MAMADPKAGPRSRPRAAALRLLPHSWRRAQPRSAASSRTLGGRSSRSLFFGSGWADAGGSRLPALRKGQPLTHSLQLTGDFCPRPLAGAQFLFQLCSCRAGCLQLLDTLPHAVSDFLQAVFSHKLAGSFIKVLQVTAQFRECPVVLLEQG